jgi:hypothetical protein
MEIKYELEIKISVEIDGEKVDDVYTESGSGPCDDVSESMDMFVKPRIGAAGFVMTKKIKKDILKKLKEGKE